MWKYSTFILLVINISLLIVLHSFIDKCGVERGMLTEKINNLSYINYSLQNNIILSKQGSCIISPNTLLCTSKGDSILLSDLERSEYTLVLRYSTQCCSTCVEDIIDRMLQFKEQHPNVDILLLTTYKTEADKVLSKRVYKNFSNVCNVFSLKLPLEEEIVPYLFVLDKNLRVIDTFVPTRELPDLTQQYLNKIAVNSYK